MPSSMILLSSLKECHLPRSELQDREPELKEQAATEVSQIARSIVLVGSSRRSWCMLLLLLHICTNPSRSNMPMVTWQSRSRGCALAAVSLQLNWSSCTSAQTVGALHAGRNATIGLGRSA